MTRVIGTAGHVDHGKSTLVRRLTGIDPDRLAEEKAREMTIDLGFAWLTLPPAPDMPPQTVGIVDVPGHRDFIENMLAGVGGIDAVLLVIAADEGIMPQTREHLAILDLLGVAHGLIVMTKCDTVDDPDWLALVENDIEVFVSSSSLAGAAIVRVSAHTGEGIPLLLEHVTALLARIPPRPDLGHPRLPVDRVFTMPGFGTVVTGTLTGGALRMGDEVMLMPPGLSARVRGLQSYKQRADTAYPGSRVAVNLAGIEKQEVTRGMVITHPGQMTATTLVDVHFRHLSDASRPLKHNALVKVFCGTSELTGYVRLLDAETLSPGAHGWVQIRLDDAAALAKGDRFILRYPSPPETIGGGVVVDPHPLRRWRRFQPDVIAALETRMQGTPLERLAQAAEGREPLKRAELQKRYGEVDFDAVLAEALAGGQIVAFDDGTLLARTSFRAICREMVEAIARFHEAFPLRAGLAREELRSRMGIRNTALAVLLAAQAEIVTTGTLVKLAGHEIRFDDQQQAQVAHLLTAMDSRTPPSLAEAVSLIGEDLVYALIDQGELVQLQPDVLLLRSAFETMTAATLAMIDTDGDVTAKALRDRFDTSRKYAIALLEYLDSQGITRRVGDVRVRGKTRTSTG